jgi:hypothetical protein
MPVYNPNQYAREDEDRPRVEFLGAGKHRVTVRDHELSQSSGGLGQLIVTFADAHGAQIRGYLIYEGKAGFQLAALLTAVGWSDPIDLDRPAEVRKAIYGKWLQVVAVDEEYQGKVKTKIKYYNKIAGNAGAAYDKHETRGRREEPQSRTGGGWNQDPHDDGAPPPNDDDGIPF